MYFHNNFVNRTLTFYASMFWQNFFFNSLLDFSEWNINFLCARKYWQITWSCKIFLLFLFNLLALEEVELVMDEVQPLPEIYKPETLVSSSGPSHIFVHNTSAWKLSILLTCILVVWYSVSCLCLCIHY